MKPLELTVYPQPVKDQFWIMIAKRLTDEELAAEYWRAKWTGEISQRKHPFMLTEANLEKIRTVERFMTLPHASETNYE